MLFVKSAYARHMGVSRQTVYGWIARGEIVLSGDKVDVEATQSKILLVLVLVLVIITMQ
jgi:transposase